jgi:hypothetical protein
MRVEQISVSRVKRTPDHKGGGEWNSGNAVGADAAQQFRARVEKLEGLELQLLLAKLTGNFKRGNERQ